MSGDFSCGHPSREDGDSVVLRSSWEIGDLCPECSFYCWSLGPGYRGNKDQLEKMAPLVGEWPAFDKQTEEERHLWEVKQSSKLYNLNNVVAGLELLANEARLLWWEELEAWRQLNRSTWTAEAVETWDDMFARAESVLAEKTSPFWWIGTLDTTGGSEEVGQRKLKVPEGIGGDSLRAVTLPVNGFPAFQPRHVWSLHLRGELDWDREPRMRLLTLVNSRDEAATSFVSQWFSRPGQRSTLLPGTLARPVNNRMLPNEYEVLIRQLRDRCVQFNPDRTTGVTGNSFSDIWPLWQDISSLEALPLWKIETPVVAELIVEISAAVTKILRR